MSESIKRRATRAFGWSLMQSWVVKAFALLVFFLLSRLLSPADLGTAQVVTLVLALLGVLGEFGFHSALVQQRGLRAVDVTLPFAVSVGIALLGSTTLLLLAEPIARVLDAPQAAPLLRLAALIPPLTASSGIVVALYRRELDFASIARAGLAAGLCGGLTALALAWMGLGAMALVGQALVSALVTAVMVWHRSPWHPGVGVSGEKFPSLLRFSSFAFASALVDFVSLRMLDVLIVGRFGVAMLGVYTVGAKLYLTLLELLGSALIEVSASMMARLRGDVERVRRAYLRLVFVGACTTSVLFAGMSALAPELCELLFGPKWVGAAEVTRLLCLLGAVQVVQFYNGATLMAHGRSHQVLLINLAKLGSAALALGVLPAQSVRDLALAFVLSQLAVTPLSFGLAMRLLGLRLRELLSALWPGWLAALIAWASVAGARPLLNGQAGYWQWLLLATLYFALVLGGLGLFAGRRVWIEIEDLWPKAGLLAMRLSRARSRLHLGLLWLQWWLLRAWVRPVGDQRGLLLVSADTDGLRGSRGDEAMLEVCLSQARRQGGAPLYLGCSDPVAEGIAEVEGSLVFPLWGGWLMPLRTWRRLRVAAPAQVWLLGADVLDGAYSPVMSLRMLILADLSARCGAQTRLLGFSLNAQPALVRAWRNLDSHVRACVRDPVSLERYRQLSGRPGQAVADLAFLLEPREPRGAGRAALDWVRARQLAGDQVLVLNLHGLLLARETGPEAVEPLIDATVAALHELSRRKLSISWLLLPHDDRPVVGDLVVLARLAQRLQPELLAGCCYSCQEAPPAAEVKALMAQVDGVVSGRMHLAIAALGAGTPVQVLTYQGKFEGLLHWFDLPARFALRPETLTEPGVFCQAIEDFVAALPELRQQVRRALPAVNAAAARNFSEVSE